MMDQTDRILIAGIDCVAAIGVTPEERTMKQRLAIDVEIATGTAQAARTDSLKDALDYSKVATVVMDVCRSRDFHPPQVRVLVRKISPVLEPRVNYVSVEIVRSR